jgi:hypothetical protein
VRFFLCAEIWQLGGFFPGNIKKHTKIVIYRDLLPFFEIKNNKISGIYGHSEPALTSAPSTGCLLLLSLDEPQLS